MSSIPAYVEPVASPYNGVRMTAEEFFRIPDDRLFYELVDGVVIASPSPTPVHQAVAGEFFHQLSSFLDRHPIGWAFYETDVHLGIAPHGADVIYRPEIAFFSRKKMAHIPDRLRGVPDLVVEVVSPGSERMDRQTKLRDYERFGVREYPLIDPQRGLIVLYRLRNRRYVESRSIGASFSSEAIPGFVVGLTRIRRLFPTKRTGKSK